MANMVPNCVARGAIELELKLAIEMFETSNKPGDLVLRVGVGSRIEDRTERAYLYSATPILDRLKGEIAVARSVSFELFERSLASMPSSTSTPCAKKRKAKGGILDFLELAAKKTRKVRKRLVAALESMNEVDSDDE